ncbi:hypothetical protein CCP3SC5AM1_260007 [Gammaproteobacteria bacterium]
MVSTNRSLWHDSASNFIKYNDFWASNCTFGEPSAGNYHVCNTDLNLEVSQLNFNC